MEPRSDWVISLAAYAFEQEHGFLVSPRYILEDTVASARADVSGGVSRRAWRRRTAGQLPVCCVTGGQGGGVPEDQSVNAKASVVKFQVW